MSAGPARPDARRAASRRVDRVSAWNADVDSPRDAANREVRGAIPTCRPLVFEGVAQGIPESDVNAMVASPRHVAIMESAY